MQLREAAPLIGVSCNGECSEPQAALPVQLPEVQHHARGKRGVDHTLQPRDHKMRIRRPIEHRRLNRLTQREEESTSAQWAKNRGHSVI